MTEPVLQLQCRSGCGACCIAASISSPLPNMPGGKPAGQPCVNLDPVAFTCGVWGTDEYPDVCRRFLPSLENCGTNRNEALASLSFFEAATDPAS